MTEIFTGILRSLGDGYAVMRLDTPESEAQPATPFDGVLAVTFETTQLRARAVALIGARVRIRGRLRTEAVPIESAHLVAEAMLHADGLEDLDVRPDPFGGERRPSPTRREPASRREAAPTARRPPMQRR